ncbi:deoxyribonuclease [Marinobacter sp. EhC06]|jgi:diguanylate cyclase (GGDEF)-like protein|uniref:putative bifunctional diguanylate cyclase/phosphodiesterase n=1 Tax=Marinobacter TaxID=2742 RepID=UPI0007DA40CF|nr:MULTISPECIES: EAL domain-containing protein [unclassified Marinobacter]OAN88392.1 deoxyribonuclease [Marinobacter sp. EhN04]OAN91374.1 deoxyribonuclease [Marinobacter sp. EhC06]
MQRKPASSLSAVQIAMLVLGALMVVFIWALFGYQTITSRTEALQARQSEHRNLALIVSESLKQMTDRAKAMGSLVMEDPEQEGDGFERLLELLAEDPVFNRLSVYDGNGDLLYASHPDSARPDLSHRYGQLESHMKQYGVVPLLPLRQGPGGAEPGWRLPFLVPAGEPDSLGLTRVVLIELDIGYLAGLLQHVELGPRGFIQVLDAEGAEWMRADTSGVIVGGLQVPRIEPALSGRVSSGQRTFEQNGQRYQYVFVTRAIHGFTVSVTQPFDEILAPLRSDQHKQLLLNILMTLLVGGIVFWLVRALKQQQSVLQALQLSEQRNQQLIERLEGEHARSSRAASIDHLSGLYNRRQFLDIASQTLNEQRRNRRLSALLFIDLDRFKSINDSLGHQVGDLLLQAVAGRIRRMLGPADVAARFGGDEFVVLLAEDRSESDIETWASGLTSHLSATYELNGTELNSSPSIGIAICPRDGQTVENLLRCADAAMYSAKKAGRGQYRFFDQSLNLKDVEEFHLEQSFAEALRNREFVLHYQPQVCLDSMEVIGYEALVRWHHPEFGLLFPDRFIPMAENSGFVIPLGMEVLRLACAQIAQWKVDNVPVRPVAVNVSPIQLAQQEFCRDVINMIHEHGLKTCHLELEITETAMLDAKAVDSLHSLKAAGVKLSLDDFGTGYSGFAHLEAVPVDKLKIDRSLIAKICNSHDDSPIVSSTIILAKRMDLKVVAEGVETREQVVHLKVAGCDIAQGYHLSRPMPPEDVPGFLRTFAEAEAVV